MLKNVFNSTNISLIPSQVLCSLVEKSVVHFVFFLSFFLSFSFSFSFSLFVFFFGFFFLLKMDWKRKSKRMSGMDEIEEQV